jgi:UDP-N-acetylmuramyl pentapeptide phosphotransferase/UDP-N-acetylglucosamine-1-phosphate transferase
MMAIFSLPISNALSSYLLIVGLTAFLIVLIATPLVRDFALQMGKVDLPSSRKVHGKPMVRLGGVAICLGAMAALAMVIGLGVLPAIADPNGRSVLVVVMGGLGFFLIGLADDLVNLAALPRLLAQLAVSALVWQAGVRIEVITLPGLEAITLGWFSLPLTLLWLTGVVNAINWIDGLDGLAAGVGAIAAAASALICLQTGQIASALVMVALLGSLLGFLVFNFNPAQIFMGDGGSYLIGFLLAGVGITGLVKTATATAIFLPVLVLAVPLLDMSAVILGRLLRRQSPFLADKSHLHHRLLGIGLPHRLTVLTIYALTWWVGSLALVFVGLPSSLLLLATALLGLAWIGWKFLQVVANSPINSAS